MDDSSRPNPWFVVEQLAAKARSADSESALLFVMANETFALVPYRSALVFTVHQGEPMLSTAAGLTSVDRRSAFGSWSEQVIKALLPHLSESGYFGVDDIPEHLREVWQEYWPEKVLVGPLLASAAMPIGVVVYVTDAGGTAALGPLLNTLHQLYGVCLDNLRQQRGLLHSVQQMLDGRNLKTRRYLLRGFLALLLILGLPIRQFVIVPAEIISLDAIAVTAPVEGIVAEMVAKPNQAVKKGDGLIRLDDTALRNRLASARQALEVSRAEYLASAHRAFMATEKNEEAGVLKGRINEHLAEVAFLEEQLARLDIKASRDGLAVYGQENDWIGKPVNAGQRIMELADDNQIGVNAWVPVHDAINLQTGAPIQILLYADPLNPMTAIIDQASYQATRSPDGLAAYRVRAVLPAQDKVRLGLRGSAKINGEWVMMGYFLFRRPLGVLRQWLNY